MLIDQGRKSILALRRATVVNGVAICIQHNYSRNAGHVEFPLQIGRRTTGAVDIDLFETDVSKFWSCCVKHGRK